MAKTSVKKTIARDAQTSSVWQNINADLVIEKDISTTEIIYDVLIIGAGITGITTGLLLQKAGKNCVIAEANNIGFGTTGGTTAHLNTFFDATYPEIESDFGEDAAKQVASAGKETLNAIKNFIQEYKIDCDFEEKNGYLFSETDKESKQLADILKASQNAGIDVTEVDKNGVPIAFQHSLNFKKQAQFHPLKYILALAAEFKKLGGVISENTIIRESEYEDNIHIAKTDNGVIKAKNIVYATHIPPGINLLSFRCAPYRSYVLGIKLKNENDYPDCLAYDMQEPYHYFRTHVIESEKYLILGGEDHKTGHGDPEQAFKNLEDYAHQYYQIESIPFKWSAQYYVPVDGLPYIGKMPSGEEKTYIATGFNGNGMIFGTLSGLILSDYILGKENKYAELFEPSRLKPIAGFTEFVKENADVAYHFVADRFSTEDLESLKDLNRGEGKIVDFEHQKLAIYKDDEGLTTALNPVCTHAKCIVNFNSAEKSWDCPCHGGRFDLNGHVITGPPRKDLEKIDISK